MHHKTEVIRAILLEGSLHLLRGLRCTHHGCEHDLVPVLAGAYLEDGEERIVRGQSEVISAIMSMKSIFEAWTNLEDGQERTVRGDQGHHCL